MASITDVENKAKELADLIQKTEVYQEYLNSRREISKDGELKKSADEYRRRNFELQNSASGNPVESRASLMREYEDTMSNRLVKDYLDSEIVLCRMMQYVNDILYKDIDIDMTGIL